jgi:hypothetical protein
MRLRTLPIFVILVAVAAASSGCRFLAIGPTATASVATPARDSTKPAPRTIQLELVFVRCDAHDATMRDELWTFADEQFLPAGLRGRLATNGLRVGIIGDHLPPEVAARLMPTAPSPTAGNELATDAAVTRRRLQLLPDRRGEILTSSGIRELVVLERVDDGVSGATYRDASTLLAIEVTPAANGTVQITAIPEIRHGPLEKSWVGEDGMFRLETGQRRHRLEHLQFIATLPRDGMLVVGCAGDDSASVGDCLLRDHERGKGTTMRLVMIRPLADTIDPSFTSDDHDASSADDTPLTIR